MKWEYDVFLISEFAVCFLFRAEVDFRLLQKLYTIKAGMEKSNFPGVKKVEVTFRELIVFYDPHSFSVYDLIPELEAFIELEVDTPAGQTDSRLVSLPVCYHGSLAPDIERVEKITGLRFPEVIEKHVENEYRVFMIGFLPGFLYLGGLDTALDCPRLKVPRKNVPAGSVGIAASQTGIYSVASPGGWNIIGRMPLKIFDWAEANPPTDTSLFKIKPMDRVRFVPVSLTEYKKWEDRSIAEFNSAITGEEWG